MVFKLWGCLNLFQGEDERSIKCLKNLSNYSRVPSRIGESLVCLEFSACICNILTKIPWMCLCESPGETIIRNTEASIVLSFKLKLIFSKWNSLCPSVSRTVLQHEFSEKRRSGFCYFFESFTKKFLWGFPNVVFLLERLRSFLLLVLLAEASSGTAVTL